LRRVNISYKIRTKNSFIFNLGHGILPETPIENVELLVKTIRETNYLQNDK
jgi:uroporphyrinogen decarboxylase